MKKSILALMLLITLTSASQNKYPKHVRDRHEPEKVINMMFDKVSPYKQLDSVKYENFIYVYKISVDSTTYKDSMLVSYYLTDKIKTHYRPYTAIGVLGFNSVMCTMIGYNSVNIPNDKKLHFLAGYGIGYATSTLIYSFTGKKWLSCISGGIITSGVGMLKERYDLKHGGVCSNADALYTIGGGLLSSLSIRILLR